MCLKRTGKMYIIVESENEKFTLVVCGHKNFLDLLFFEDLIFFQTQNFSDLRFFSDTNFFQTQNELQCMKDDLWSEKTELLNLRLSKLARANVLL